MTEEETFSTPDDEAAPMGRIGVRGEAPETSSRPLHDDHGQVVNEGLTPAQAFEVFAGRSFQNPGRSSTNHRSLECEHVPQGSVSVVAGRMRSPPVDPVSRYFRLRAELDDLEADLEVLTTTPGSADSNGDDGGSSVAALREALAENGSMDGSKEGSSSSGRPQPRHNPNEVLRVMREELGALRRRLAKAGNAPALKPLLGDGSLLLSANDGEKTANQESSALPPSSSSSSSSSLGETKEEGATAARAESRADRGELFGAIAAFQQQYQRHLQSQMQQQPEAAAADGDAPDIGDVADGGANAEEREEGAKGDDGAARSSSSSSSSSTATFELFVKAGSRVSAQPPATAPFSSSPAVTLAGGGGGGHGTGDEASIDRVARLQSLEQRLHRLESVVGTRGPTLDDQVSPFQGGRRGGGVSSVLGNKANFARAGTAAERGGEGLLQALSNLSARVGRLEPSTVLQAREELAPLQKALEQILVEQKRAAGDGNVNGGGGNAEDGGNVNTSLVSRTQALYRRTQAIDDFGPDLPHLVSRLRSLQSLHEHASRWLNRLYTVEQRQLAVGMSLESDRAALRELTLGFSKNLEAVAQNVAQVDRRLELGAAAPAAPPAAPALPEGITTATSSSDCSASPPPPASPLSTSAAAAGGASAAAADDAAGGAAE